MSVLKVLVIGSSGMLGSSIKSELLKSQNEVYFTKRRPNSILEEKEYHFDFEDTGLTSWFVNKPKFDFVINCIGAIPQKYAIGSDTEIRQMIELNTFLPQFLSDQSILHGFRVIQIATDCVFSGRSGNYTEESRHDAFDIYGVTKSLGEKYARNTMVLRCSIIGRNDPTNSSLHNWLLAHKQNATLSGYRNHLWNGVTTVAFARIVRGVIDNDLFETSLQHVVPSDEVSKNELLHIIAECNNRNDLNIVEIDHNMTIDRTLISLNPKRNQLLWECAGYEKIPSITELVIEMDA